MALCMCICTDQVLIILTTQHALIYRLVGAAGLQGSAILDVNCMRLFVVAASSPRQHASTAAVHALFRPPLPSPTPTSPTPDIHQEAQAAKRSHIAGRPPSSPSTGDKVPIFAGIKKYRAVWVQTARRYEKVSKGMKRYEKAVRRYERV